jgi:hypothetical protein
MNDVELVTKNGYIKVEKTVVHTETRPVQTLIKCNFGSLRSSHIYNENLFDYLVRKLKELK